MDPVVGIDLGTTNSIVALVEAGRVRVLGDRDGKVLQPSVVSFHPSGKLLVGQAAKDRRVVDPANTVFSIKRLIGRDIDSREVSQGRARFPFELVEGPNRSVVVRSRGQTYTLPEISALVLKHLKGLGEAALGQPIRRAVITVPANFNDVQRSSTKVAGRIAGLEVLRILNEPTAAALAYGYGRGRNERIAIYDFGGGTFDITILQLREHVFEVLSTAGDTFLGGDDIDLRLADQLAEAFLRLHRVDLKEDRLAFERLRAAAEQIKIELSAREPVEANIEELAHEQGGKPLDLEVRLTRGDLEACIEDLLDRTFEVCDEALRLAGVAATELDNVILVGGTTRIPIVRHRVARFFGRAPLAEINPEEVVAVGAAIQGFALAAESARERKPTGRALTGEEVTKIARSPYAGPGDVEPLEGEPTQQDELEAGRGPATRDLFDDTEEETTSALHTEKTVRKRSPLAPEWGEPADEPAPRAGAPKPPPLPADLDLAPKRGGPASPKMPTDLGLEPKPEPVRRALAIPPDLGLEPKPMPSDLSLTPKDRAVHTGGGALPDALALEPRGEPPAPKAPRMPTMPLGFGDDEVTAARKSPARSGAPAATESPAAAPPVSDLPEEVTPLSKAATTPRADTAAPESRPVRDPTLVGMQGMSPGAVGIPAGDEARAASKPARKPPPVPAPRPPPPPKERAARPTPPAMPAATPPAPTPPAPASSVAAPQQPDGWGSLDVDEPGAPPVLPPPGGSSPAVVAAPVAFLSDSRVADIPRPEPSVVELIEGITGPQPGAPSPPPVAARPVTAAAPPVAAPTPAPPMPAAPKPAPARPARSGKPILIDVTPQSLGVQTVHDNCETVIARNSNVPIEQTRSFSTSHDDQDGVVIRVCQGESKKASENVLLGEVTLDGIRRAARGEVTIDVTFEIDADGILQVSARDTETGRDQRVRIVLFGGMGDEAVRAAMQRNL